MSNWAQRPLSREQLDYAANDTYFLLHIAMSLMKEAQTKGKCTRDELEKFFEDQASKAAKVTFRLKSQDFDPEEGYRKYFKRLIDFYDQSDEYLQSELVFREIFALREICAERIDVNKELLLSDAAVLILARQRPTTEAIFAKVLQNFSMAKSEAQMKRLIQLGPLLVQTIADSLASYPS